MGRLSTGAMERPEPEGVAHELVVSDGVEAQMTGVESLELLDPLPLECDLPFRWHPPLVFPPLSGGTRLSGWFLLEGIAQVDPGGSLSVSLSPSKRPDQRSMPSGKIVILSRFVAVRLANPKSITISASPSGSTSRGGRTIVSSR